MRPTRAPATAAVSTALLAVLAVSACGSSGSASPASGSPAASGGTSSGASPVAAPSGSAGGSPSASSEGPQDNGEAGKPAAQVLADTKSALFNAGAVHVAGNVLEKGQGVVLDMQFQGQDASGTIGVGGTPVSIVRTGGKVYLRASAAFWQKTAGPIGAKLADRWLVVDAQQAAGVGDLTLQSLAASLSAEDSPLQAQVTRTQVEGRPAVQIMQQDGSTAAVSATGQPVPLVITSKGASSGRLVFRDYGKTLPIAPPPGAVTPQEAAKAPATGTA